MPETPAEPGPPEFEDAEGPGPAGPADPPSPLVSYAQHGEDILLHRLFPEGHRGFYLDVGANHPTLHSVTKHFYDRGWRGVNLTHPLKEEALAWLATVAPGARRARSVNTVTFEPGGAAGESTDGPGFVDLLRALGRDPAGARVVLLGAGGAARSIALALLDAGAASVTRPR